MAKIYQKILLILRQAHASPDTEEKLIFLCNAIMILKYIDMRLIMLIFAFFIYRADNANKTPHYRRMHTLAVEHLLGRDDPARPIMRSYVFID